MKTLLVVRTFAVLGVLVLALASRAADTHLTNGIALKGHDPVAYFTVGQPQRGIDELRLAHAGAIYLFASTANRDAFAANPGRYLPQYGGYCAFGVSRGYKADIDPAAFSIVDGKLYLNYNREVQKQWQLEQARLIRQADERWDAVRATQKVHR